MQKWQLNSTIGKGRPLMPSRCLRRSSRCLHTTHPVKEAGKDQAMQGVSTILPDRAKRLRAASNEIQNLYERSAAQDRSNAPPPSSLRDRGASTEVRAPPNRTEGFKVRYEGEDGHEAKPQFQQRATAPADLKERLRKRALQRQQGQSDTRSVAPTRQGSDDRPTSTRRPRDDRQRTGDRKGGVDPVPATRKGGSRSGTSGASSLAAGIFDMEKGEGEGERYAALQAEYEDGVVRDKITDRYARNTGMESDEEQMYMDQLHPHRVEPVLPNRESMMAEGPGIASSVAGMKEIMAEKLALASRVLEGDFVHWASKEEKEDVLSIVERLKHANPEGLVIYGREKPTIEAGQAGMQTQAIMQKVFGGRYALKRPDGQRDVLGHVERAVGRNKTYFPADENVMVKEVAKLLGRHMQPQGKVGQAVKAGAREGTKER